MRQPQVRNWSFVSHSDSARNEPPENRNPIGAPPDRVVGGQHPDDHRRHAHGQECGDQRRLAADAIAEMTEERRSDRSSEECDAEGSERGEDGGRRIRRGKKEPRENKDCRRRVNVEVEELDGRADQARKQDLAGRVDDTSGCGNTWGVFMHEGSGCVLKARR
jgi:hypothetical protein